MAGDSGLDKGYAEDVLEDCNLGIDGVANMGCGGYTELVYGAYDADVYAALPDIAVDVSDAGGAGLCHVLDKSGCKHLVILHKDVALSYPEACDGSLHVEMLQRAYHDEGLLLWQKFVNVYGADEVVGWCAVIHQFQKGK